MAAERTADCETYEERTDCFQDVIPPLDRFARYYTLKLNSLTTTPSKPQCALPRSANSPILLAIAHDNLWTAFSWMIREESHWTCFTCWTKIDPKAKEENGGSIAFYMHAERMTAVAKLGAKEYFIAYESMRPKEEKELAKAA